MGSNNVKYAIVGVVLIIATLAIWFGMQSCEGPPPPPPPPPAVDAGVVERGGALVDETLLIPELEPDAGPVDAGRRVRYVTRYVGGGGSWNCGGAIDPSAARAALAQRRVQFRNCYERRLKVNHQLQGRVNVRMRVSGSGEVTAVQVGGSMRDGEVLSCVRRIADNIRFPAPSGGRCAVVAAPFNFTPRR